MPIEIEKEKEENINKKGENSSETSEDKEETEIKLKKPIIRSSSFDSYDSNNSSENEIKGKPLYIPLLDHFLSFLNKDPKIDLNCVLVGYFTKVMLFFLNKYQTRVNKQINFRRLLIFMIFDQI